MDRREQTIAREYYSPKALGSLGGVQRLYRAVRNKIPDIKLSEIRTWLNGEDVYTLFKQARRRFPRIPILVDRIDEQWQIDLMDMTWLAKDNDDYRYLLNVIDCFSRFAWVIPMQRKRSEEIIEGLKLIFNEGRIPEKIQSDQGKEFKNEKFMSMMKKFKINFFTSTDDVIKCAIVERFNRTLRTRIYHYLSFKSTKKYIDVLNEIVESYNHSFHRTIGMSPSQVSKVNSLEVLLNIRKTHPKMKITYKPFKVGDKVRISRAKGLFEKGSTTNFSEEIFQVRKVKKTPQGYIYRLKDWAGEDITSIFYHYELVPAIEPSLYKIEKILKTRTNPVTKEKEYFVKWQGYPNKFNSWTQNVEST